MRGLPEIDPGRAEPGELSGEIEINHVSFRYQPDGPLVLDDVCADQARSIRRLRRAFRRREVHPPPAAARL